jgi:acyl-CoA synthetase (AMP-forming)/AMP-acid ligase II
VMGSPVLLYRESRALKTDSLPRWIRTGDEVVIDENNDLFIVDRLKVDNLPCMSR